jgi:hypothetical protein
LSRTLRLTPSRGFAALLVAAHVAAGACAALALPGWPGGLLACALAALGLASAWSRALLRSPGSPRSLTLGADASAELANGASFALCGGGHVSRFMVTLAARGSRRRLLVTAGMLDRESFRALRVWALWGKLPAVAGKQLGG